MTEVNSPRSPIACCSTNGLRRTDTLLFNGRIAFNATNEVNTCINVRNPTSKREVLPLASVKIGARDGTLWRPANIGSVAKCMVLACLAVAAGAFLLTAFQGLAGIAIAVLGIVVLAFLNGGNDLPKSIATLIGSNALSPRRALALGAICTLLGGTAAVFGTGKLLTLFSGGGITLVTGAADPLFPLAVIGGATAWMLYATKTGLPVSTTHALVGASLGGALVTTGIEGVRWTILLITVVVPLLLGPLAAGMLGYTVGKITSKYPAKNSSGLARTSHLLSAGGASFARALNDTPKIVGVGLLMAMEGSLTASIPGWSLIGLAAAAMAAGGVWASRHVIHTLAFRVVRMDGHSGLVANTTNTGLVGAASFLGLPLSTTHVSGAALIGACQGAGSGSVHWTLVRDVVNGWVVTVPAAAALAASFWGIATALSSVM